MKKVLLVLACIVYVLSPIDLVPDVIPIGGWADDVLAIALTIGKLMDSKAPAKV